MATLWAWAKPTPYDHSPIDHTWVTDFDNRVTPYPDINAVRAASANYWYCWGSFHRVGTPPAAPDGFLGERGGDIAMAECLCSSNEKSAATKPSCGTIERYGIDGVCHQLANQVLWATGTPTSPPLTVSRARGYHTSTFFYGTYGQKHAAWAARIARCVPPDKGALPVMSISRENDEFVAHAAAVLGVPSGPSSGSEAKLEQLLIIREAAQSALQSAGLEPPMDPSPSHVLSLNAIHHKYLHDAARILENSEFERIFGFPKSSIDDVQLVSPEAIAPDETTPPHTGATG